MKKICAQSTPWVGNLKILTPSSRIQWITPSTRPGGEEKPTTILWRSILIPILGKRPT